MKSVHLLLISAALWAAAVVTSAHAQGPQPALPAAKAAYTRLLGIATAGPHLIAVGQQGVVLKSANGNAWEQLPSPVSVMLNRARFFDDKRGWIVGYDASILSTRDGGASWQLSHSDAEGKALHDILFLDGTRGIAVGAYGTVLSTQDGGAHWQAQETVFSELSLHLNAILKLLDGSLLIVGEGGLVARSSDAGANWTLLKSPYIGSWFGALPYGEKGALLFGMRGNVFSAADITALAIEDSAQFSNMERQTVATAAEAAAMGWRGLENEVQESLFGGSWLNKDSAVLVGVNGVIARADLNAGKLEPLKKLRDEPLSDVVVFNKQLLVVGRRGIQNLGAAP